MTTTTMEKAVADGADWLDENYPGWVDSIDLGELIMSGTTSCVLGQVWTYHLDEARRQWIMAKLGPGREGLALYGFTALSVHHWSNPTPAAHRLGFSLPSPLYDLLVRRVEWARLTQEWRTLILARRMVVHPDIRVLAEPVEAKVG